MSRQRRSAQIWCVIWLAVIVLLWGIHRPLLTWLGPNPFPGCSFHLQTGYLCPACGNTRAVLSLLSGHPLRSLGYNPMIVTLCAAGLGWYAELLCMALGKSVQILPRRLAFWMVLLAAVLGYDVVRNFFPAITLCTVG